MPVHRPNFFLFTGGPGVGKTTLVEHLKARGETCVPETHRQVIREQAALGDRGLPRSDQTGFRNLCGRRDVEIFDRLAGETRRVFFDRGILDSLAGDGLDPPWLERAAAERRYAATVFAPPPWAEIYETDAERIQDFAEAVATHDRICAGLTRRGYQVVELPRVSVEDRAAFVLEAVARAGF
ncbi:AAA family ATPase [Phenylobacterium aquaticum]|uniref:AAA family ATPase n=1 Tax=Phenylobacterium aquaticum TaxID=1763816 RepID=UPI0026EE8DFE|nr:AAA family ATPase [Phenylobacterium aquaticum]